MTSSMTIGGWQPTSRFCMLASMSIRSPISTPTLPARATPARWLAGWPLTLWLGAAIAGVSVMLVVADAGSADALRRAIRFTARTSFALFIAAFTASALWRLTPNRFTRWQLRNRRYLGVAFAASHTVHAAAISTYATLDPGAFESGGGAPIPGLVAYALIVAMTVTSFDRTAAWLGHRAWKLLHLVGSYYLCATFLRAFAKRAIAMPIYWLPVAIIVAALALRLLAWQRERRARQARAGTALRDAA
jgi:DMSO/TMAO reductase YedYZ heme-binding membrane subunit